MSETKEKRRFHRVDFQKKIRVFPVLPSKSGNIYEVQKESFDARSFNISEGGLSFGAEQELDPQFLLKMNFEAPGDLPVEVYAKVIWAKDRQCGVRFIYTEPSLRNSVRSISSPK